MSRKDLFSRLSLPPLAPLASLASLASEGVSGQNIQHDELRPLAHQRPTSFSSISASGRLAFLYVCYKLIRGTVVVRRGGG